jgi:uracil-DNA glycosylase
MKISQCLTCDTFPCVDVNKTAFVIPYLEIDPRKIKALMISESPPENPADYFYAPGSPDHLQTTLQAFNDGGIAVKSMKQILYRGFYLTTAIKCAKIRYAIDSQTIKNCARILEREINFFTNLEVFLLMGDVAIKAFNEISRRQTGQKAIPAGSTYKIRQEAFTFQNKRVIPSYVQTGKNYLIERSKRRMIAEDIQVAWQLIKD